MTLEHADGKLIVTITDDGAGGAIVGAGWAIGQPAVTVAQTISNYALWIIVATVVLIVAWSTWSAWRSPRVQTRP